MENLSTVIKSFQLAPDSSLTAMDVHESIENFVGTTLKDLADDIQANVIVTLPDETRVDAFGFGYDDPDTIYIWE
jgi:hypothetical protein